MMKSSFLNNGVTAHRGNSSRYPENTIAAFKSALVTGADWIELDVRRTKDGQIVVIHDEDTGRVGSHKLEISGSSCSELRKVDVAFQFRKTNNMSLSECPEASIPLLSEVIDLIKAQRKTR
ncbi:MAG: glycerophosphodiester phosphodiesterase family protein, partial [Victivallales bacterium]